MGFTCNIILFDIQSFYRRWLSGVNMWQSVFRAGTGNIVIVIIC